MRLAALRRRCGSTASGRSECSRQPGGASCRRTAPRPGGQRHRPWLDPGCPGTLLLAYAGDPGRDGCVPKESGELRSSDCEPRRDVGGSGPPRLRGIPGRDRKSCPRSSYALVGARPWRGRRLRRSSSSIGDQRERAEVRTGHVGAAAATSVCVSRDIRPWYRYRDGVSDRRERRWHGHDWRG